MSEAELEINSTDELNQVLNNLSKDPSINKPSEEEVEQAKKEFEEAAQAWQGKVYKIGKPEDAQEFCDYIRHFIRNRFMWTKDAWMGAIKLTEELDGAEKVFKGQNEKSLELGYQALEFTYFAFSNLGGVGLQAALDFEQEAETFVKVATEVEGILEVARKSLKEIEFLQQKWGAMAQGFYLEVEPEDDENIGVTEDGTPIHPESFPDEPLPDGVVEEDQDEEEKPE